LPDSYAINAQPKCVRAAGRISLLNMPVNDIAMKLAVGELTSGDAEQKAECRVKEYLSGQCPGGMASI